MKLEIDAIFASNKSPEEKLDEVIAFLDNVLNPREQGRNKTKDYVISNLSIHDFEPIPPFAD